MPAEKRPPETQNDEASSHSQSNLRRSHDDNDEQLQQHQQQQQANINNNNNNSENQSNNNQKTSSPEQNQLQVEQLQNDPVSDEDLDVSDTQDPQEFAYVDLQTIRKEVQCPICLGIIKKTRTVMECLHRFCRDCIDKSMRMGNNECPACRTHCASRRSLRDDPRYDALIAALYPDIRKFEEEELAFCEEDETRNKQIQDSISEVLRKQSEALGKKRPTNKDTATPSTAVRNPQSRRRKRKRRNTSTEYQDSDDNNDANDSDKHFDPDEHHIEIKQRKGKNRASIGSSHSPSATTNLSGGSLENNVEQSKEERGLSPAQICSNEKLAWGRGGVRSNTRNSNGNGGMGRNARRIRLAKLVDFLRNLDENDEEYVAIQTSLKAENVQVLGVRDPNGSHDHLSTPHPSSSSNDKLSQVDPMQDRLHLLDREETLSGALASCISNGEQLILAYQQKEAM